MEAEVENNNLHVIKTEIDAKKISDATYYFQTGRKNPEIIRFAQITVDSILHQLNKIPEEREIMIAEFSGIPNSFILPPNQRGTSIYLEMQHVIQIVQELLQKEGINAEVISTSNDKASKEGIKITLDAQINQDTSTYRFLRPSIFHRGKYERIHSESKLQIFARRVPEKETKKIRLLARKFNKAMKDILKSI